MDEFPPPRLPGVPDRLPLGTAVLVFLLGVPLSTAALVLMALLWIPESEWPMSEWLMLLPFAIGLGAAWYLVRWIDKRRRAGHMAPMVGCGVLTFLAYVPICGSLLVLGVGRYGWSLVFAITFPLLLVAALVIAGNWRRIRSRA